MQKIACPIFKIPIDGRRKKLTQQTIHDNEKLNIRILENKQRLQIIDKKMVNKKGKKMTMFELYNLALTISQITKRKIDRLARRNRNGLLCWLAESIDIISNQDVMNEIKKRFESKEQHEQTNQEESSDSQPENVNQNINVPYPEIAYTNNIPQLNLTTDSNTNNDEKTDIQRKLFPDFPEQIVLPPLINHKSKSINDPHEIISIYNLLNRV